jgi:hypothetical protein
MKNKVKNAIKESKEEKDSLFKEIKFKSQAAMEYLMTYGWAILIIALTLAVLYSLGIMNPKNFIPRAPPGSCFVFRPNGPGTTDFVSLQGTCGYLPMYVASFNGVDSYISVKNAPNLNPTVLTVCSWVRISSYSTAYQSLANKGEGGGTRYQLRIQPSPSNGFEVSVGNGTSFTMVSSITVPKIRTWYFACATADGSIVKIYVNGVLENSKTQVAPITATGNPLILGARDDMKQWLNGTLTNVQLYNTALTPQEIQYLYQQGLGGGPVRLQNLVGWWPLNGDAKDYSGNNNHGTIYNVTFVQNYNPP